MRTRYMTTFGILITLTVGHAQAQQWNDLVQPFNNVSVPDSGTAISAIGVQVAGAACGAGNSPLAGAVTPGPMIAPSGCSVGAYGFVNIDQFARQSDLLALQAQISAMDQMGPAIQKISLRSNQGVAMSLAMAGVADLQSDEHIAFSGNWGTFQGQNGGAVGVAYRVAEHVSVNAGFAGSFDGGTYGGRAGIRIGW